MKRPIWIALAALAAAVLVTGGLALAQDYGYGPGMMGGGGYGPGMMGGGGGWGRGGFGSGMMGFGTGPALAQLPAEKQEQLRKLQVTTMQSMVALMSDMQVKGQALHEALGKFPIDQTGAKKAHDAMDQTRTQMFALHLTTLAQAQQIMGKETWESLQSSGYGPGHGPGPGGMMGPGPRGPAK